MNLFTRISISSQLLKEDNYLKFLEKDNDTGRNYLQKRKNFQKYKSFQKLNNFNKINEFMNTYNKEKTIKELNNDNKSDIKEIISYLDKNDLNNKNYNTVTINNKKFKTPRNIKRNILNEHEKNNIIKNNEKEENNKINDFSNSNFSYLINKKPLIINNKIENEKNESNNNVDNNFFSYFNKSNRIKKEINNLDEEIVQLQSRLNQLLIK